MTLSLSGRLSFVYTILLSFSGIDTVRFKAEINFDGREITKVHLNRLDIDVLLRVSVSTTSIAFTLSSNKY